MGGYLTVRREASAEFTERRSRFIGCAKPVGTEKDALSFLNTIRSKHWDASHNVYAYALRSGQLRRYSDDGEPQGTAGIPVLDVLVKSGLVDTAVVVTRYFGGVLLGAGGLVRAYSHAASLAVR
ncbi:MAG TPA: YigZ family protein, partial [Ruminococcaceae bacterium]|nr:YigZ family protein [Oscillospiraceae bacterium]